MSQSVAFEEQSADFRAGYEAGMRDTLELAEATATLAPLLIPASGRPALTLDEYATRVATVDEALLRTLVPYNPDEAISIKTAAARAGKSDSAIRDWIARYRIGRHVVGSVEVSAVALAMLLDGATVALARYVAGDREHPDVLAYFARVGLNRTSAANEAKNRVSSN